MSNVKLSELGLGAVEERFQWAVGLLAENVSDPNMDPKVKRKITIELEYKPSESDPKWGELTTKVTPKLAGLIPLTSGLGIGIDGNGEVKARETVQQNLFDGPVNTPSTGGHDPIEAADTVAQQKTGKKIAFGGNN